MTQPDNIFPEDPGLLTRYRRVKPISFTLVQLLVSFVLPLLLAVNASWAADSPVVDRVTVRGNNRVEGETILLQTRIRSGDKATEERVASDVKEIFRTGFFDDVAAKLEKDGAKVVLVFQVKEKPAIRKVLVEGAKEVKEDTIKEKLNIGPRFFLDRRKLTATMDELAKYYQGEGYYGTKIDYQTAPAGENQVDLTVKVEEGEKKRIREIEFSGNSHIDSDELEDVIRTKTYRWWISWLSGSGVVKQEELENDVRELNQFYLTRGHVDIKIAQPRIEELENGLKLVYALEEGEVYSFDSISASGDLVDGSVEKTLEGAEIKPGEVFNVEKLRKDTFTISEKFTDVGYAFANVEPGTNINRQNRTVDVNFATNKGSLVTVNRINITGNKKTKDHVIRRSLQLEEQSLFSGSKIRRSQELLQRLGYFDEVAINTEPLAAPDQVDLNVGVREGSTGTFSVGAGVSSGDGFIFSTRISENNLFGTGNSATLDLNNGTRRENYVASFTNPRVNDSRMSMGFDILSVSRVFDDFDRSQAGGSVTLGYPLWFLGEEAEDDVRASLGYELLHVDIDDVDLDAPQLVKDEEGTSVSSSVTPQLTRNTIDNPLDPSKGSKQQTSIELAGIGGDERFWLFQAANTFYYPLWKSPVGDFVFSQRTRFGYGETYDGEEDFPLFKRFFPGGINSVRGYDSRELGPKDEQGNEYGGNKQLILNFELIFPLAKSVGLSGVTFYDMGEAFDDDENIEFSQLRHAIGWGIRWKSPLAPIRIEFGYPLDKEPGDKSFVTNFSFGAPS